MKELPRDTGDSPNRGTGISRKAFGSTLWRKSASGGSGRQNRRCIVGDPESLNPRELHTSSDSRAEPNNLAPALQH
jgi:hypothetical protein